MTVGYGDRIVTDENGRVTLRLADLSVLRVPGSTILQLEPTRRERARSWLKILAGWLYLNNRDTPEDVLLETPTASCAIQGTELVLFVEPDGSTRVRVIDGQVELTNSEGGLVVQTGQAAEVKVGQRPVRTPGLEAINDLLQWCLYYPAILDPGELRWSAEERQKFGASLGAYAQGDLLAALERLPSEGAASFNGMLYRSALELAVGRVESSAAQLDNLRRESSDPRIVALASALLRHVQTVKGTPSLSPADTSSATAALADSYACQARGDLEAARTAAQRAVDLAPDFGFAWARLAELEFSFGRAKAAEGTLAEALRLSPRNAQALTVQGFVQSARGRFQDAMASFERAIAVDGGLGNAWLGRGLINIRRGQVLAGLQDLQTAVTTEPQRAVLRSYLSKAFDLAGNDLRARHEFELAQGLDPNDPTAWFYRALVDYTQYRTTEALENLGESIRRNDNRQLYRSRLLLDQDASVRSANLARVYDDAGMPEIALQESARAVMTDYANASAHLNLAASYETMRDPARVDLRYDTLWLSEHLVASLLAPVGAVPLSQNLSQMEYTRLFEGDRVGLNGTMDFYSSGEFRAVASQYGNVGGTSWALDVDTQFKSPTRVNDWVERVEWYTRVKQQLGPADSVLLLVKYQDYEGGDNFARYDPAAAHPDYWWRAREEPIVLAGFQHEWGPGMRTLFLGGYLQYEREAEAPGAGPLAVMYVPAGPGSYDYGTPVLHDIEYANSADVFSAELQQVWERPRHTDILGGRFQGGRVEANSTLTLADPMWRYSLNDEHVTSSNGDLRHYAAYWYHSWKPWEFLTLLGGVAYERAEYPANYQRMPLTPGNDSREEVLPKGAIAWSPHDAITLRGMYSQSLGEMVFGHSFRLEPTQLGGFPQAYRQLLPEGVAPMAEAAPMELASGAVDLRFGTSTYGGFEGGWLNQRDDAVYGVLSGTFHLPNTPVIPSTVEAEREYRNYEESYAGVSLHQVLGRGWFAGARYRFTHSHFTADSPGLEGVWFDDPVTGGASLYAPQTENSELHQAQLSLQYSPPSGLFARVEANWYAQQNGDPMLEDDSFPYLSVYLAHRFPRRRGEVGIGLLNLTDEDYRLNPLTPYRELFRDRTVLLRVRFNL